MNRILLTAGLLILLFLAGCANAGKSYADQHPSLPAAHRQILATGKIEGGTDVAGMTREQVRLAMGGDPATFDKINGEDAWVYTRKKAVAKSAAFEERGQAGNSRMEANHSFSETEDLAPRTDVEVRTTIFFQGNLATHSLVTEGMP
jgi:outer membrane protein assembly factor BamE (lipoprotein component of BamABCDE complex)